MWPAPDPIVEPGEGLPLAVTFPLLTFSLLVLLTTSTIAQPSHKPDTTALGLAVSQEDDDGGRGGVAGGKAGRRGGRKKSTRGHRNRAQDTPAQALR